MSKSYKSLPAAADLWELFSYNPLTGQLYSRDTDKPVGWKTKAGRLRLRVNGNRFLCHRVVWKWVHAKDPKVQIDHVDLNGSNNRLWNLREALNSENCCNKRKMATNSSGYKGVSRHYKGWRAIIGHKGKIYRLGTYDTPEEAHQAYCTAAADLHGDFARIR